MFVDGRVPAMGHSVAGRRVLITGAARGVGAELARRLHERGARVALAGLEPELLAGVALECGDAPWAECDVADHGATERAFAELATDLTARGCGPRAAAAMQAGGSYNKLTPLPVAIDAVERGIARRSRRVVAPAWVGPVLPLRAVVQRVVEVRGQRGLPGAL